MTISKDNKILATIELDTTQDGINDGDRGGLFWEDDYIHCILPNGDVEQGDRCERSEANKIISDAYGRGPWDLQWVEDGEVI